MGEYNSNPDLLEQIKELQQRVETLEKGNPLQNASIDISSAQAASLDIGSGNLGLRVYDSTTGRTLFFAGADLFRPRPDGTPQPVYGCYRDDGSLAFSVADLNTADGYEQVVSMWDREGNQIVADDTNTGFGLAYPYIPVPLYSTDIATAFATSSGSFVTAYQGVIAASHPRLRVVAAGITVAPTEGDLRVLVNGVQEGSTDHFTSSTFMQWDIDMTDKFLNGLCSVELQIRRTAGASTVACYPYYATGKQS